MVGPGQSRCLESLCWVRPPYHEIRESSLSVTSVTVSLAKRDVSPITIRDAPPPMNVSQMTAHYLQVCGQVATDVEAGVDPDHRCLVERPPFEMIDLSWAPLVASRGRGTPSCASRLDRARPRESGGFHAQLSPRLLSTLAQTCGTERESAPIESCRAQGPRRQGEAPREKNEEASLRRRV